MRTVLHEIARERLSAGHDSRRHHQHPNFKTSSLFPGLLTARARFERE
jgi:hypothetical protein